VGNIGIGELLVMGVIGLVVAVTVTVTVVVVVLLMRKPTATK